MNTLHSNLLGQIFQYIDTSDIRAVGLSCKGFRAGLLKIAEKRKFNGYAYELLAVKLSPIEKTFRKVWEAYYLSIQKAIEPLTLKCLKPINNQVGIVQVLKLLGNQNESARPIENWGFRGIDLWQAKRQLEGVPDPNNHHSETKLYFLHEAADRRYSSFIVTKEGARALANAIVRNNVNALVISTCLSVTGYYESGFDEDALFSLCQNLPSNGLCYAYFAGNLYVSKKYPEKLAKLMRIVANPILEWTAPGRPGNVGCSTIGVRSQSTEVS